MPFENVNIDGLNIFYREAGKETAPKLVLLHGFPASSHQYLNLIPPLADRFHVIAPDYPGFGNSDMPDPAKFSYTFDNTASIVEKFLNRVGFTRFGLYVQDYGGPVGFRIVGLPTRSDLRRHGTSFAAITGKPAARSRKRQLARFSSPRRSRSSTPRGIPIRS